MDGVINKFPVVENSPNSIVFIISEFSAFELANLIKVPVKNFQLTFNCKNSLPLKFDLFSSDGSLWLKFSALSYSIFSGISISFCVH